MVDLEKLYRRALKRKTSYVEKRMEQPIYSICHNRNKSPIRFLMSGLIAKIDNPFINLHKPTTALGGADSFEGRGIDEKVVEPFVLGHQLPCNSTTAFLTPSFRIINRPLSKEMFSNSRPPEPYYQMMDVVEYVELYPEKAVNVLLEIIRVLIGIKADNDRMLQEKIDIIKAGSEVKQLSSEEIVGLVSQHLACKNSSRLPVLIVAAAYKSVEDLIGERARKLLAHQAADKQTGSLGDVEITLVADDQTVTCYEMKCRAVLRTDIEKAIGKISQHDGHLDNYIFITTDPVDREVSDYAVSLYREMGTEIAILDCLAFLRHFLHFFHRRRIKFLDAYQNFVISEPTSSVSQALKEAFLALRIAAQDEV